MRRRFIIASAVLYSIVIAPASWFLFFRYGFCYDCTLAQRVLGAVLLVINFPLVLLGATFDLEVWLLGIMSPLVGALWGWLFWLGRQLKPHLRSA